MIILAMFGKDKKINQRSNYTSIYITFLLIMTFLIDCDTDEIKMS